MESKDILSEKDRKDKINNIVIKIKDRLFKLKEMPKISAYAILKNDIKGAEYDSNNMLWIIPPTIHNFQVIRDFVIGNEFYNWYLQLMVEYKKKKKTQQKEQLRNKINQREQLKSYANQLKEKYPFLYKFQLKAVLRCVLTKRDGFLISLDPGLGKTLTSLIVTKERNVGKVWIVCPASLQKQWCDEIKKWLNEDDVCIYKGSKIKRTKLYGEDYKYNIISYETLRNDIKTNANLTKKITNCCLIADESSKLKNRKSQLYKSFKNIVKKVNFQMYLTGTPLTNNLFDMNNTVELIDKSIISDVNDYCVYEQKTIGWGRNAKVFNELVGYKNLDNYVEKIKPVYERKSKLDVADQLPKRNIITHNIQQHSFLHDVADMITEHIGAFSGFSLLQMLECGYPVFHNSQSESVEKIKLLYDKLPSNIMKQITDNIMPDKIERLIELVEEINEPTIIFTHYIYSAKMVEKWLKKSFKNKTIKCTIYNDKDTLKDEFTKGWVDVVVATDTWSHGVSLSDINYLINYDIIPSLETYLQRIERIYRIDSKDAKFVYNLVGDIVEYHIMNILQNKLELFDKIVEGKSGKVDDVDIKKQVAEKLKGK